VRAWGKTKGGKPRLKVEGGPGSGGGSCAEYSPSFMTTKETIVSGRPGNPATTMRNGKNQGSKEKVTTAETPIERNVATQLHVRENGNCPESTGKARPKSGVQGKGEIIGNLPGNREEAGGQSWPKAGKS